MADNFSLCLIGAMDRLWFHQIILFPEPFSLFLPKAIKQVVQAQQPNSDSVTTTTHSSDSSLSLSSLPEENSAISSPLTLSDDSKNEKEEEEEEEKKRPTRVSPSSNRSRSHSSSPSAKKRQKNHRHSTSCSLGSKLQKSMSCRSLKDLELEEVKGFMDLGFVFRKEHLNKRMISVVPGLLRLGFFKTKQKQEADHHYHYLINLPAEVDDDTDRDDDDEFEQEERGVIRPYLSEAWLIRRPGSPLLNLRIPKLSASADMKKHLKFWARTVASEIQQEC